MTSTKGPAKEEPRHLGYVPGPGELSLEERERISREAYERPAQLRASGEAAFPPQWDWRAKDGRNFISAPKNQGSCGACTAFAAASTIEAKMRIDLNVAAGDPTSSFMPELSEAQLFFCGGSGDCQKGSGVQTMLDYAKATGVVPDTIYAYDDQIRGCRVSVIKDWQSLVTRISGWKSVIPPKGSAGAPMKEWISTKGPMAAALTKIYEDFTSFKGDGVYKWNGSSPRVSPDGADMGHAVCVIGYDDSRQAWLIKNSWGANWGSGGFAYVAYGECGIDGEMWGVDGMTTTYPFLAAAGLPSACVYKGQAHYCYRDASNNIQDVVWTGSGWKIQQIAGPGSTSGGPAAAGNPAVVGFKDEMHCFYRDSAGEIWDAEWSGDRWYSFQLTGKEGIAGAPQPLRDTDLAAVVFGDQIHCVYRNLNHSVVDVVSGTNWSVLDVTSLSRGQPALSNVAVAVHSGTGFNQLHYCYRFTAKEPWNEGDVYDSLYDNHGGWQTMQVTGANGKAPKAPKAAGDPSIVIYSHQTHYCYRDARGIIWDVTQDGDNWTPQQVTGAGGNIPTAPAAADDPFVIVWSGTGYNQMHYCYRDESGFIWDAQWSGSNWIATQVTGANGKIPGAPAAAAGPFVFIYGGSGFNQMHYCYRDKAGHVQDAFWSGSAWGYQTI